jgi:hypothetical protein
MFTIHLKVIASLSDFDFEPVFDMFDVSVHVAAQHAEAPRVVGFQLE